MVAAPYIDIYTYEELMPRGKGAVVARHLEKLVQDLKDLGNEVISKTRVRGIVRESRGKKSLFTIKSRRFDRPSQKLVVTKHKLSKLLVVKGKRAPISSAGDLAISAETLRGPCGIDRIAGKHDVTERSVGRSFEVVAACFMDMQESPSIFGCRDFLAASWV